MYEYILIILISFILGSFNSALVISFLFYKKDLRKFGSTNAGLTNTYRVLGVKAAIFTAIGDILKTIIAIIISEKIILNPTFDIRYLALLFVILGHLYPVFFSFKGGKGALSLASGILLIEPIIFAIIILIALVLLLIFKKMSLVSIIGAILLSLVSYLKMLCLDNFNLYNLLFILFFSSLILFSHRSNIKRLIKGKEPRLF